MVLVEPFLEQPSPLQARVDVFPSQLPDIAWEMNQVLEH
jgi:hypothetical protein